MTLYRLPAAARLLAALGLLAPTAAAAATEALPQGFVFEPLLADPKRPRFLVSVLGARVGDLHTTVAAVAYGGRYGLVRWPGKHPGDGWQLNLSGAVFAQFDLKAPSMDLVNADYTLGLPLTYRHGRSSLRLRIYHQSSHLGDEYLLRNHPERVNLSYESLEAIFARDIGSVRAYAGGEYFFHREPSSFKAGMVHGGLDYRGAEPVVLGWQGGGTYLVAGVDVKAFQHHDWEPAWSLTTGLEFHPTLPGQSRDKYWSLLAVAYKGPSPYGQFFTQEVRYWGLSMEFNL
ncbi:MAG TPA: DUF1207 domain-containing protein [Gammaproteobacteria bacterium]|nr:DUF1207 domain-containing protein [Gammaproteobacteria bacterium]